MVSLDVNVDLQAALGRNADALDRNTKMRRRAMEQEKARVPLDVRIPASAVSPSSGDVALAFGGPDPGFYWMVRRVLVGGQQWSSAVNGSAELYVTSITTNSGSSAGIVSIRNLTDMVDQAATLPSKAYYGLHELPVQQNENLVVVIHSPSASTTYSASAQIQVFRTVPENIDFVA